MTAVTHQRIPVEQGDLPLTIARSKGTAAAVVIVPSAFGVGPDLETQMQELAASAALVVAIDPFFRGDAGVVPYEDTARIMARLQVLDRARCYRDLRSTIDWVRAQGVSPAVVVVGICFGGPLALLAAADHLVDGVVTWHGSRMENFLERAAEMRCPMSHHFGGVDPVVKPEAVEAIRGALGGHPDVRFAIHEGATHGFSHRGSARSYDERAERAGMESVRALAVQLAGGPP